MLTFGLQTSDRMRLLRIITLCLLAPVTGLFIVRDPIIAWELVGLLTAVALFECSAIFWAAGAVATATLSRASVAAGAPHFLNFVHFPLVLGAFSVALLKPSSLPRANAIKKCIWIFLAVNVVSWLVNGGELLRPVLNWLVITEPFLLLYVLVATPTTSRTASLLWKLLLGICFLQVPLGMYQRVFISGGNPDLVQGTFIGSGTGAHVSGAVAMLGVTVLVCLGAASKGSRFRMLYFVGAIPLFGLAVLADAKQAVVAFIPGLFFGILKITKVRPSAIMVPITFLGVTLYMAFHFYKPLQKVGEHGIMSGGFQGKMFGFLTILSGMGETPTGWLIGLGPGNTVSRVALMTPDAELDATSSIAALGLKTTPLTRKLLYATRGNWLWKSSSAWSPACSWFGLIGDLGLIGTAVYLWMLRVAWRAAASQGGWLGPSATSCVIALVLLGGVYSWLEEPGFTLMVALLLGLAILPTQSISQALAVLRPIPSTRQQQPSFARSYSS
jgi:hypothetical protein